MSDEDYSYNAATLSIDDEETNDQSNDNQQQQDEDNTEMKRGSSEDSMNSSEDNSNSISYVDLSTENLGNLFKILLNSKNGCDLHTRYHIFFTLFGITDKNTQDRLKDGEILHYINLQLFEDDSKELIDVDPVSTLGSKTNKILIPDVLKSGNDKTFSKLDTYLNDHTATRIDIDPIELAASYGGEVTPFDKPGEFLRFLPCFNRKFDEKQDRTPSKYITIDLDSKSSDYLRSCGFCNDILKQLEFKTIDEKTTHKKTLLQLRFTDISKFVKVGEDIKKQIISSGKVENMDKDVWESDFEQFIPKSSNDANENPFPTSNYFVQFPAVLVKKTIDGDIHGGIIMLTPKQIHYMNSRMTLYPFIRKGTSDLYGTLSPMIRSNKRLFSLILNGLLMNRRFIHGANVPCLFSDFVITNNPFYMQNCTNNELISKHSAFISKINYEFPIRWHQLYHCHWKYFEPYNKFDTGSFDVENKDVSYLSSLLDICCNLDKQQFEIVVENEKGKVSKESIFEYRNKLIGIVSMFPEKMVDEAMKILNELVDYRVLKETNDEVISLKKTNVTRKLSLVIDKKNPEPNTKKRPLVETSEKKENPDKPRRQYKYNDEEKEKKRLENLAKKQAKTSSKSSDKKSSGDDSDSEEDVKRKLPTLKKQKTSEESSSIHIKKTTTATTTGKKTESIEPSKKVTKTAFEQPKKNTSIVAAADSSDSDSESGFTDSDSESDEDDNKEDMKDGNYSKVKPAKVPILQSSIAKNQMLIKALNSLGEAHQALIQILTSNVSSTSMF
jgi:hypothetical protein